MPYIKKERRQDLLTKKFAPATAGELNFILTQTIIDYVKAKGLSYETINSVVGALDCCKFEFYRRVAIPYEDRKIIENGDCYDVSLRSL